MSSIALNNEYVVINLSILMRIMMSSITLNNEYVEINLSILMRIMMFSMTLHTNNELVHLNGNNDFQHNT